MNPTKQKKFRIKITPHTGRLLKESLEKLFGKGLGETMIKKTDKKDYFVREALIARSFNS